MNTTTEAITTAIATYQGAKAAYAAAHEAYQTVRRAELSASSEATTEALHAVRVQVGAQLVKLEMSEQFELQRAEESDITEAVEAVQ